MARRRKRPTNKQLLSRHLVLANAASVGARARGADHPIVYVLYRDHPGFSVMKACFSGIGWPVRLNADESVLCAGVSSEMVRASGNPLDCAVKELDLLRDGMSMMIAQNGDDGGLDARTQMFYDSSPEGRRGNSRSLAELN